MRETWLLPLIAHHVKVLADAGPSSELVVAVIAALATIFAALLPSLLPIGRRAPRQQLRGQRIRDPQERLVTSLEHQLSRAHTDEEYAEAELRNANERIAYLEALCYSAGVNPRPPVELRKIGAHDEE